MESGYQHLNGARSELPSDVGRSRAKRYLGIDKYCDRANCSVQRVGLNLFCRAIALALSGKYLRIFRMRRSVSIQQLGRSTRCENLADIVNDLGIAVDRLLLAEGV